MACISPEQQRQKDQAKREAIANTMNVNATGEKTSLREYDDFSNQINDE
jgi:hypothetical protein